ncbi:hypothetical protein POVCU1_017390 [Plasmodium ovale curtisi]|uniref:Uncharacterized protein n=1 Tax=Plasmodium ovale curtisi TaxID=864141 RepID=A0A1A8WFQ1_PLAOA|nr:hypothetical protein POVCU1_017390 [Plasmodium ovale curtisi]
MIAPNSYPRYMPIYGIAKNIVPLKNVYLPEYKKGYEKYYRLKMDKKWERDQTEGEKTKQVETSKKLQKCADRKVKRMKWTCIYGKVESHQEVTYPTGNEKWGICGKSHSCFRLFSTRRHSSYFMRMSAYTLSRSTSMNKSFMSLATELSSFNRI